MTKFFFLFIYLCSVFSLTAQSGVSTNNGEILELIEWVEDEEPEVSDTLVLPTIDTLKNENLKNTVFLSFNKHASTISLEDNDTLIKAPFFFVAVASQANVDGASSAPVVALAFNPALATRKSFPCGVRICC